jgi:hypothetical protein
MKQRLNREQINRLHLSLINAANNARYLDCDVAMPELVNYNQIKSLDDFITSEFELGRRYKGHGQTKRINQYKELDFN